MSKDISSELEARIHERYDDNSHRPTLVSDFIIAFLKKMINGQEADGRRAIRARLHERDLERLNYICKEFKFPLQI